MDEVKIFLTNTGLGTWTVPDDWNNNNNSIECIGAGANGQSATYNSRGGGGGAYARKNNVALTKGSSVNYYIGTPSTNSVTAQTYFQGTSFLKGAGSTNFTGGTVANSVGTVRYAGGNGGTITSGIFNSGSGGGACGGPFANGGNGYPNVTTTAGNGGDSYSFTGGNPSRPNGLETSVSPSYMFGSGGRGAQTDVVTAGNGGFFGAGGGGKSSSLPVGIGAQGVIIITYTPVKQSSSGFLNFFLKNI